VGTYSFRREYQLKNIREQINNLIEKDDSFAKNQNASFYVRIDSFSDSSIDMLVQTFTVTNDWAEFLKIKENLAVKIIEIVENNNDIANLLHLKL